jgi:acyl-CoA synthetase (AMP-forming)/AMP-acid ligase II
MELVSDVVVTNAGRIPDEEAVVDGDRRLTWRELLPRVTRLANGIRHGLGVGRGGRVCVLAPNCLEYYELFHAAAGAGVIPAPLNQRLSADEILEMVEQVEPRALFFGAEFEELAGDVCAAFAIPGVQIDGDGPRSYGQLLAGARVSTGERMGDPEDAATICFTGGTTGTPKGVVLSHRALLTFARNAVSVQRLRGGDRHLFVRPMYVAPGHRMVSWHGYSGGTTVIAKRFEPKEFIRLVDEERITTTLLNPTMFRMLLDEGDAAHADVSSLRAVTYGGAPMTPDLLAEVVDVFDCDLVQSFGGTEIATSLTLSPEDHRDGRLDSLGREVPGVQVRLVDDDGGQVPIGEPGEITVRSGQLMSGYWRNPSLTSTVLRDGWCWTGDLGRRDEEGYFYLAGRKKDMIISGGFNIYPVEVENALTSHPAVREAAVIGVPDRRWVEAVHACIVLREGKSATVEELIEHCRARIGSYKKPRSVEFLSELPRTPLGKVAKEVLRETRATPEKTAR